MDNYTKLENLIAELKEDFQKFYEQGNKSAGSRIRKKMQELKKLAQEIRVDIQNKKNGP